MTSKSRRHARFTSSSCHRTTSGRQLRDTPTGQWRPLASEKHHLTWSRGRWQVSIRPRGGRSEPVAPALHVRRTSCEHAFVTSQGSAHGRFSRAVKTRNLWAAEAALREMGTPSLLDALDYLALLAETKPEKVEAAAVRWHGRLEVEASAMTLGESQLALAALASLAAGEREAVSLLRALLRRVNPMLMRRMS